MEENKNLVTVESDVDELLDDELAALLEETVNTALTLEGVALPCEVNILLTDDEGRRSTAKCAASTAPPTF